LFRNKFTGKILMINLSRDESSVRTLLMLLSRNKFTVNILLVNLSCNDITGRILFGKNFRKERARNVLGEKSDAIENDLDKIFNRTFVIGIGVLIHPPCYYAADSHRTMSHKRG